MSYEVLTDDLRAHVSHLEGLMDRVQTAMQAAQTVSMDDQAYGLICAFLPGILNPMEEKGAQAMTAASDALGTTADNVNQAIAAYEDREQATAQPFSSTLDTEGQGTPVGSGGPGDYVVGGPQMMGPGPEMMGGPGPVMTGGPIGPDPYYQGGPPGPGMTGGPMGPDPYNQGGPMAPDPYYQGAPGGPMAPGPYVQGGPMGPPGGMAPVPNFQGPSPEMPLTPGAPVGPPAQQPFMPNAPMAPLAQSIPAEMPSNPGMPVTQQPFAANLPMAPQAPEPFSQAPEPFQRMSTPMSFPAHETTAPEPFMRDSIPASAPVQPSLRADSAALEGYSRVATPLEPALEPMHTVRDVEAQHVTTEARHVSK